MCNTILIIHLYYTNSHLTPWITRNMQIHNDTGYFLSSKTGFSSNLKMYTSILKPTMMHDFLTWESKPKTDVYNVKFLTVIKNVSNLIQYVNNFIFEIRFQSFDMLTILNLIKPKKKKINKFRSLTIAESQKLEFFLCPFILHIIIFEV